MICPNWKLTQAVSLTGWKEDKVGRTNYEPGRDKNCLRGFQESEVQIEISLVARRDMILSNKQITKALIRMCGCAGWSAPLLFTNHRRQVSRIEAHIGVY